MNPKLLPLASVAPKFLALAYLSHLPLLACYSPELWSPFGSSNLTSLNPLPHILACFFLAFEVLAHFAFSEACSDHPNQSGPSWLLIASLFYFFPSTYDYLNLLIYAHVTYV